MHNAEAQNRLIECWKELKDIQNAISSVGKTHPIASYLTRYSLIRCCGTFEISYKRILVDFTGFRLCPRTELYVEESIVKNPGNPRIDLISRQLNKFDRKWGKQFRDKLKTLQNSQKTERAIKELVELRNSFAHGQNTSTTFSDVRNHFVEACRIVKILDRIVGQPMEDPREQELLNDLRQLAQRALLNTLKNIHTIKMMRNAR